MVGHVYLLDTSVLLAALLAPERLPKEVAAGISESSNTVYFSSASIWEVAIKHSLQRVNFDFSPQDIHRLALDTGFTELMVKGEDCYPIASFPWYHRDPFDRLLVAQAQSLPAYLLTTDGMLKQYSELVVHLSIRTTQGS
ncbi:type II toxin-antitoxin system VapC family toxin [Halothiobacillus sp.]|uniref:type II toxin-antitoxin system VapC family toxin n=1 Tax=Halothiobacillus sp. TaxID=1891311 RepID=UPI00262FD8E7|nr:type II toxin-antitoxin system VapC family toxin [Halothiobacillus sp.]